MMSSTRVQPRSHRRYVETTTSKQPAGALGLLTTLLLVVILMTGPLVLGAARLWIELPLLVGVAFLLLIQGLRLARPAPSGSYRLVDAIDLAVIVFLLYTIGRWLTSPAEYFSRLEAMNVFAYAVIFFTCRYGLAQRSHGLALLFFLVTLGIGETIFGYLFSHHSYLGDPASLWFPFGPTERLHLHYAPRWLGTYGCPNHYVSLLVMASGAALALGSFSKLSWPLRIVLFYFAGIMAIGVAYSGSRGGWVAFVAMLIALMIFGLRYGMIRWWLPVVSSLVFFVFFACLFGTSRDVLFRFQDAGNTMGGLGKYVRIELDEDALRIAQDYPVIGSGPATFAFIHPRYQRSDFGYKAVLTHDDYLNCLDDYGLVGFGLAMFFVAAVTIKFFGRLRADNRWHDRVMVATGFAAWCALLFHSTVDFNLHIPANALLLFALTGLALGRIATTQVSFSHWSTLSLAPLGRWLGWFLIMISFTYGALVVRTWLSDRIYEQVADSARVLPTDQSVLDAQQALRIDPGNVQALVLLGDLYRYQASRQRDIEGRVQFGQQALDAYARALRINTLDDTVVARQGMTFDVMRRYSEAFFCYSAAVRAQPYNGQFWNVLGNHYWQRNLLEKAEQAYRMASRCPHGFEGSGQAIKELRVLLDAEGVPPPPPGTNPLLPRPEPEDVPTTP